MDGLQRMKPTEPREKITAYVPASLRQEVDWRAEIAGQTLSVWVERALKAFIATSDENSSNTYNGG